MRIDAHQGFRAPFLPDRLAPILARYRFEGSVAVGDADELLEAADRHEFVRAVVARVERAGPEWDRWQAHPKFRGICCRPDAGLLAEAARRGLTADLEIGPAELPLVESLAARFPDLRLILDHLARPVDWQPWARHLEAAAAAPNVFCKISGLLLADVARNRPFALHALRLFGPQRVMFGSEWPVVNPWKQALAAFTQCTSPLPNPIRELLVGGTATLVYRL